MPQRDFDIHIYYDMQTRPTALAVHDQAIKDFSGRDVFISRMVDQKVGPHPQPMFEIVFAKEDLSEMIFWLIKNRQGLNVLLHQVTGDDPKDHSAGAMWFGQSLELDFSKF